MRLLKLVGFLAVFCFVASPAGALASELVVFPNFHDFGDIQVGRSRMVVITIMNPGEVDVDLNITITGHAAYVLYSIVPDFVSPGQIIDIEISFNPDAMDYLAGGALVNGEDAVELSGLAVQSEPTPEGAIEDILTFFDASVADGTLVGCGPNESAADKRLDSIRNMLEATGDLIRDGLPGNACAQLANAYQRCDGLTRPPEFVDGPAASILSCMILELIGYTLDLQDGLVTHDLMSEDETLCGQALLRYDESVDGTDILLSFLNLEPGTEHVVLLYECNDAGEVINYIELGSFTTNETGSANLNAHVDGDVSEMCVIFGVVDNDEYLVPMGGGGNYDFALGGGGQYIFDLGGGGHYQFDL